MRTIVLDTVAAAVLERQRLAEALRLVVAGAGADRIDVAPVGLRLGVFERVAVDLRCRCEDEARPAVGGEREQAVGAGGVRHHRLDRELLVVHGARRRRQVEDEVDGDERRAGDVLADERETRVMRDLFHVLVGTGGEIVEADHVVAPAQHFAADVTADEAGPTGNEHAHVVSPSANERAPGSDRA